MKFHSFTIPFSDETITAESTGGMKVSGRRNKIELPMNTVYTRGIDVQQVSIPGERLKGSGRDRNRLIIDFF